MSEHTKPALQGTVRKDFLACVEEHIREGTYAEGFKLIEGQYPETFWATTTFKDHQDLDVLFGVGAHWDEAHWILRYECRLSNDSKTKNKLNLGTIEEAAKYFPRNMLEIITNNCHFNRRLKAEAIRKEAAAKGAIAPLTPAKSKNQSPQKSVPVRRRLEKKLNGRGKKRAYNSDFHTHKATKYG